MAPYSGTLLPKKLGIKAMHHVALIDAPETFEATLGALPDGVALHRSAEAVPDFDVIVLFVVERAVLEARYAPLCARLTPAGGLWVAWPKKASRVATDVTEGVLRDVILPSGYVDNKVCAIDKIWSALRFVLRKERRPGAPRRPAGT